MLGTNDERSRWWSRLAPYNYNIEYGGNIQIEPSGLFTSLAPEIYDKAFDANGCFDDTTISISYPQLLEIDSTVFTDISCRGDKNDGSIQAIQYIGGTAPYQFSVDGGPLQGFMSFSDWVI